MSYNMFFKELCLISVSSVTFDFLCFKNMIIIYAEFECNIHNKVDRTKCLRL